MYKLQTTQYTHHTVHSTVTYMYTDSETASIVSIHVVFCNHKDYHSFPSFNSFTIQLCAPCEREMYPLLYHILRVTYKIYTVLNFLPICIHAFFAWGNVYIFTNNKAVSSWTPTAAPVVSSLLLWWGQWLLQWAWRLGRGYACEGSTAPSMDWLSSVGE